MPESHSHDPSARVPGTVRTLGYVSLLMDVSSEAIHALLPLFLTTTLGASVAMVGLIDGIGEAAASMARVVSGFWSDRAGRRKPLMVLGYGLAGLSKPLFPLAGGPALVLTARFIDRIGKGLRGPPRDALIADVTPQASRGRAYGFRQALDTTGAFGGPMLAMALMVAFTGDMRAVFWVAAAPAALAVLLVAFGVRDRTRIADADSRPGIRRGDLRSLGPAFWWVVSIGAVFTLARFSEAFLVLNASRQGLSPTLAPLVFIVMNVVYALGAYPAGIAADRYGTGGLLLIGLAALTGADLMLAFATGLPGVFVGIGLWGAHLALTQGIFAKLVAEHAGASARGAAFGLFNMVTGAALLAASVAAGVIWERVSPAATFLTGAALAAAAAILLGIRLWSDRAARSRGNA